MGFYDNFLALCFKTGLSKSACLEQMHLTRSADAKWVAGKMPSNKTLALMSEYFGVPAETIVNGTKQEIEELTIQAKVEKPAPIDVTEPEILRCRIIAKVMNAADKDLPTLLAIMERF